VTVVTRGTGNLLGEVNCDVVGPLMASHATSTRKIQFQFSVISFQYSVSTPPRRFAVFGLTSDD